MSLHLFLQWIRLAQQETKYLQRPSPTFIKNVHFASCVCFFFCQDWDSSVTESVFSGFRPSTDRNKTKQIKPNRRWKWDQCAQSLSCTDIKCIFKWPEGRHLYHLWVHPCYAWTASRSFSVFSETHLSRFKHSDLIRSHRKRETSRGWIRSSEFKLRQSLKG